MVEILHRIVPVWQERYERFSVEHERALSGSLEEEAQVNAFPLEVEADTEVVVRVAVAQCLEVTLKPAAHVTGSRNGAVTVEVSIHHVTDTEIVRYTFKGLVLVQGGLILDDAHSLVSEVGVCGIALDIADVT